MYFLMHFAFFFFFRDCFRCRVLHIKLSLYNLFRLLTWFNSSSILTIFTFVKTLYCVNWEFLISCLYIVFFLLALLYCIMLLATYCCLSNAMASGRFQAILEAFCPLPRNHCAHYLDVENKLKRKLINENTFQLSFVPCLYSMFSSNTNYRRYEYFLWPHEICIIEVLLCRRFASPWQHCRFTEKAPLDNSSLACFCMVSVFVAGRGC